RGEDPQPFAGDDVIVKSVWNLRDWRPGSGENPNDPNAIYITKPQGCAEVYYFVGDAIGGFDLISCGSLDPMVREQSRPWIESLRKLLSAPCGEVLAVLTDERLVLLSVVHSLNTSAADAEFCGVALHELTNMMDSAVNS